MQTSAVESCKQKGKESVKTLRGGNMLGDWYGYIRKKTGYTTGSRQEPDHKRSCKPRLKTLDFFSK